VRQPRKAGVSANGDTGYSAYRQSWGAYQFVGVSSVSLTKTEQQKLRSFRARAKKVAKESTRLAKDVGKELVRQMKKSK